MAENNGNDWFKLPTVGIIALVAAVASLIWKSPIPYIDERPGSSASAARDQAAAQDIEARLWQDPFSAKTETKGQAAASPVAISIERTGRNAVKLRLDNGASPDVPHPPKHIYAQWGNAKTCQLTIIAALLPGGKYAEEVEARQRQRYALLSALAVLDFAPVDAEHLGYFDLEDEPPRRSPGKARRVWFEWFEAGTAASSTCTGGAVDRALMLWVNDGRLGQQPIQNLLSILRQASPDPPHQPAVVKPHFKPHYVVIGPNQSGQLAAWVDDALSASPSSPKGSAVKATDVDFFPAMATAADEVLLRNYRKQFADNKPGEQRQECLRGTLAECLSATGLHLTRITPDDAALSRALVAELRLREVVPERSHVVLLSEWDSLYGRELVKTFADAFTNNGHDPSHLHYASYARGIDGKLPGDAGKEKTAADRQKNNDGKPDPGAIERPEGQSQKDYLRRLVEKIYETERGIQKDCPLVSLGCKGIAAIGVLGYDVYDKLLILQALRARFPGKLFFTTDLDASYLHPSEQPHTHNLIVASGFDLRLRSELQDRIPPFRDTFQTGTFYSVLLAMRGAREAASGRPAPVSHIPTPLMFEIGRNQHVGLSLANNSTGGKDASCAPAALEKCRGIHPVAERWGTRQFVLLALALAAVIMLAYRMSWTVRNALSRHIVLAGTSAIPLVVLIVAAYPPYFHGLSEEPFYWANGVSIWPSEILRLLALVMALSLLFKAWRQIEDDRLGSLDDLGMRGYCKDFALPNDPAPQWDTPPANVNDWQAPPATADGGKTDVAAMLAQYHALGKWPCRARRSLWNWFWFMAFGIFIVALWGAPHTPARGDAAFIADRLTVLLAAWTVVFLTVWLVDAARLCHRMIRHLSDRPSKWPAATVNKFAAELAMEADDIVEWIDAKFIAARTAVIQKLIWYPVAPILLLVFARNTVFDDWDFPPALMLVLGLNLGYAFSCLFLLQAEAKKARKEAVGHLTRTLDRLRGARKPDSRRIAQVEELRRRAIDLKEGAFQPLLEQPMFKALLTLLGGGGLAMTDLLGFVG